MHSNISLERCKPELLSLPGVLLFEHISECHLNVLTGDHKDIIGILSPKAVARGDRIG